MPDAHNPPGPVFTGPENTLFQCLGDGTVQLTVGSFVEPEPVPLADLLAFVDYIRSVDPGLMLSCRAPQERRSVNS